MWANLQLTTSIIRLLTEGGTPLDAMHKYGPMCCLFTRVKFSNEPSATATETETGQNYNEVLRTLNWTQREMFSN